MLTFQPISYTDKNKFYSEVTSEAGGVFERYWLTNLANVSALLMTHLPDINWVGFYLAHNRSLVLGPFQGRVACVSIPFGRGVCGTSAEKQESVVVADVHQFPGHIACDERSRSEIVVPLVYQGRVLGVLDIDSPRINRFDEGDRLGLERLVGKLVDASDWPASFL